MKRVVITGMGIWSCLGKDLKEVCDALRAGRSGIGVDQARLDYGYRSGLTGIVERPVLKKLLDRRSRVGLSEEAEYAYMASREAFENAGITAEMLEEEEVGIIFGNDSSARPVVEAARIMDEKHDSAMLGSGLIFQSMNSTVTMNLSTIFRLRGINFTVSAACASGSHAIGLGYAMIKQGLQKTVLCGGAQEVNCYAMATFDALGAFSVRMDHPKAASRPFDQGAMVSCRVAVRQRWCWKTMTTRWHAVRRFWRRWWDMVSHRTAAVFRRRATRGRWLPCNAHWLTPR